MLQQQQHPEQRKQQQKQREHKTDFTVAGVKVGAGGVQSQKSGDDLGLRAPELGEDRRRLLVAVTNDGVGNAFLDSLRENQKRLGFVFAGTLAELLEKAGVRDGKMANEMLDNFAFLDILPGYDFPVMNGVLRHGCSVAPPLKPMADVDVESDLPMKFSRQTSLGPNYTLRSNGSMHDQYLKFLNVPATRSASGIKIAVVDSGFEKPSIISGFLDLVDPTNKVEKDNFGHGTAMASIVSDIAQGAKVYSVRASDHGPHVSEAMLGIAAGSFHFQADIINLSFGLPLGQSCPTCGSQSSVSKVFYRLLRSLSEKAMTAGGPPILVAATGNDGVATGFDAPALWNFTLAVGSINANKDRSSFSNYGTTGQNQYVMMPGGEEKQGSITEWIGEAKHKCYGTSASAAYASGILALYMSNSKYQNPDRSQFLAGVLNQCPLPCNNQKTAEHGRGYLAYR